MATSVIETLRANQQRELNRQVAASNPGSPEAEQLANGIPSTSNEAALAASIEQWRATDISYQRAQNEEQREQLESAYRLSQQRLAAAKQDIADQVTISRANQEKENQIVGEALALQMQTLTDSFPPNWTPETLPMDKLLQLSNVRQRIQEQAARTGAPGLDPGMLESGGPLAPANVLRVQQQQTQARPETFSDGKYSHITDNGDGTVLVELPTTERFKGDWQTVVEQQAKSIVHGKRWGQQLKAQLTAQQAQPVPQPTAEPIQQPAVSQPTQQNSISDWWAAEQAQALARQFGFSDKNELQRWGESVSKTMEKVQEYDDQQTALQFMGLCPEFPNTQEASEALLRIVDANGWQHTAENLQAAHLVAVRNGVYQPLPPEREIPISRPPAPPMLSGNNPELATLSSNDPYQMPLAELRKQAMRQELERTR